MKTSDLVALQNALKEIQVGTPLPHLTIPAAHIEARDRQNKDSAVNALHPRVIRLFKELVNEGGCLHNTGEATAALYELARAYALIFFSEELDAKSRIRLAGFVSGAL